MPPLRERLFPYTPPVQPVTQSPVAPSEGPDSPFSPPGNPVPNRGLIPPEFMYDFQTGLYNPDSPMFQRGSVDTLTPVRNLALQGAAKAGVKVAQ